MIYRRHPPASPRIRHSLTHQPLAKRDPEPDGTLYAHCAGAHADPEAAGTQACEAVREGAGDARAGAGVDRGRGGSDAPGPVGWGGRGGDEGVGVWEGAEAQGERWGEGEEGGAGGVAVGASVVEACQVLRAWKGPGGGECKDARRAVDWERECVGGLFVISIIHTIRIPLSLRILHWLDKCGAERGLLLNVEL